MAFESLTSESYHPQIWPSFLRGYPYEAKYHNIGQLMTPYEGKYAGQGGDYGPPQRTRYYTAQNPNYPYVLDKNFRAEEYLPTEGRCYPNQPGYFPCYESKYHDRFVPPNYFAPYTRWPRGHEPARDFTISDTPVPSGDPEYKENYKYGNPGDYTRLVNTYPGLRHSNDYPPFDRYY